MNASGNLQWRQDYTPSGEQRLSPPLNDGNTGFTGHLHDAGTRLT